MSRSDLLRYAAGAVKRLAPTSIDPSRSIEFKAGVQPVAWRARDGRLWFSTIRGVMVFDPSHLARKVPLPPRVVIENVRVNGASTEPGQIERLTPGRKNLELQYTGLSFVDPGRIRFRYTLAGFDRDWTDAGSRREAFYTNLPPGKYSFRVTACYADGICNETGSSVAFALAPYYYQRPWFLPLCAAALATVGGLAHRLRVNRLRAQIGLVVAERNRIGRELHDTLIQGFSGLTLQLQALAARLSSPAERATLDDIIRDAGTYLRETRQSVAGLRSGQGPSLRLSSAIADSARHITVEKSVRLKLNLEESQRYIPAEVQYNLLRIAQEAISNSVKHSGARNIEVALGFPMDGIRLSVKDDGSGFLLEEDGELWQGHYGLIGMKERAADIGANLELTSAPGKGTTVCVLAPASKIGERYPSLRNGREEQGEVD